MSTARVLRFDVALGEALAPPVQLPNGSWVLEGRATRAGVFAYRNPDGSMRYELRHPDQVGPTAAQLAMCPLTNDHPKEGIVTPENADRLQKGVVLESHWDEAGAQVPVKVLVTHQELLEALAAGKKELSCGYQCEAVPEEGEYNGERYTHRQTGIIYNHLAVVDVGRAGPECALRLDSAGNVVSSVDTEAPSSSDVSPIPYPEPPPLPGGTKESPVEKEIIINGITFKVPAQVAEALLAERAAMEAKHKEMLGKAQAESSSMAEDMGNKEKELQAMSAKLDSANAEVATLKKLHADATDPAQVRERITKRLELERQVRPVLGENHNYAAADDKALKLDALDKLLPKESPLRAKMKEASDKGNAVYLDALFDAEIGRHRSGPSDEMGAPVTPPARAKSANELIAERQSKATA